MSNVALLRPLARVHARLREQLSLAYGLDGDDEALRDTAAGESSFPDECAAAIRNASLREAYADGCDILIKRLQERKTRWLKGSDAIRSAVAHAMQEAGEPKIVAPDMTISFRMSKPGLVIDAERIPDKFLLPIITHKPDKDAIQAAVARGDVPEGVQISNPSPVITVRMK